MELLDVKTIAFDVLSYPMSWIELVGTIFYLGSVVLIAQRKMLTWPIGIVAVILVAMWIMARRQVESWIYWIVIDVAGVWLDVEDAYVAKFEPHVVGGRIHEELWVPAEELAEFNAHIVGRIEVVAAYFGDGWRDLVGDVTGTVSLFERLAVAGQSRVDGVCIDRLRREADALRAPTPALHGASAKAPFSRGHRPPTGS